jgi:uncharacterized membrane protein YccC
MRPESADSTPGTAPVTDRFVIPVLMAISAGLALFIARRLHVDIGGLWVVLSALINTQPTLRASFTSARDQLLGTLVGVVLGAAFGLLREPAIALAAAVVLSAIVCSAIAKLRGVTYIACGAAAIVIVLPAGKPSYITAWNRLEDYLLGAAVALIVASIAWLAARWREPKQV